MFRRIGTGRKGIGKAREQGTQGGSERGRLRSLEGSRDREGEREGLSVSGTSLHKVLANTVSVARTLTVTLMVTETGVARRRGRVRAEALRFVAAAAEALRFVMVAGGANADARARGCTALQVRCTLCSAVSTRRTLVCVLVRCLQGRFIFFFMCAALSTVFRTLCAATSLVPSARESSREPYPPYSVSVCSHES